MAGRRRALAGIVGVAVLSLGLGLLAGSRIVSPGEAAARTAPPEASAITVPVERRTLTSEIVTRGDAVFDGAVDVGVLTSDLALPPVVTGELPEVGDTLDAGDVAMEIVGRPVIVLAGDLPTYRTLAPGMSGPDVRQLRAALDALGLDPGGTDRDVYDEATAAAVGRLYDRVGYPRPAVPEAAASRLEAADERVDAARNQLREAERQLAATTTTVSESMRLGADAQVAAAERALAAARTEGDATAITDAETQLAIARAQRAELLAPPDTRPQRAAVDAARDQLGQAQTQRAEAARAAATHLPAAEVVFLPSLPRRVDHVGIVRGRPVDGPVLRVSGADLVITASLAAADLALVAEGMAVVLDVDGADVDATITALPAAGGTAGAAGPVTITPVELTTEQVAALRGRNVRVTIPIHTTGGEVLAVPLAALTAGPGGQSRVEVQRADGSTDLVEVEVGLAAAGYAEVRPVETGALDEGDLVVVGR